MSRLENAMHWVAAYKIKISPTRVLDISLALLGIVILSPIMALALLAVFIESGRPLFYSQMRLGQQGRKFRILKFRKFYPDCGTSGPSLTMVNDPRLTKVGWAIDRMKINELPQLWNVLVGDMSVVGPRPETLNFSDCFTGIYAKVLDHKPGIFGPSQVRFRNEAFMFPRDVDPDLFYRNVLFPQKALIDLAYFQQRTLRADIKWIILGVFAVCGLQMETAGDVVQKA